MAGFQFITQANAPVITQSLFADASAKGSATGNAVPGAIASVTQGIQQGVQAGLNTLNSVETIKGQQLNNEAKQAQIDTLPTAEGRKNEQISNDLKAEQDRLQLEENQQNFEQQAKITRDELALKGQELSQRRGFNDVLSMGDPQKIADATLRGQFGAYFNKYPKDYETALAQVANNSGIRAEDRVTAQNQLTRRSAKSDYDKNIAGWTKELTDADAVLRTTPEIQAASEKLGSKELNDTFHRMDMEPDNKFSIDPAKKDYFVPNLNGKGFQLDANTGSKTQPVSKTYTAFDKQTGQILASGLDSDVYKAFMSKSAAQYKVSGKYSYDLFKKQEVKSDNTKASALDAPAQSLPANAAQDTASDSTAFANKVKTQLAIPDPVFLKVKDSIQSLSFFANTPTTPETELAKNASVTTVSRTLSDAEYDSNPSLQHSYNGISVDAYNRELEKSFGARVDTEALKAKTGKELYYNSVGAKKYVPQLMQIVTQNNKVKNRPSGVKVAVSKFKTSFASAGE